MKLANRSNSMPSRRFSAALVSLPLGLLATGTGAQGQVGNPASAAPAKAPDKAEQPSRQQLNNTDRVFAVLVGAGGLAEVEAARLVEARASAPGIKQFAQRMIQDHGRANEELADLARQAGVTTPAQPDPEQRAMHDQLKSLSGRAFDVAYLRGQLVDHQKTMQLLLWEIGQGQHAGLQRYASGTLPAVMEHLDSVQALLAEATGTSSGVQPAGQSTR
jgi:putative membrane protein